MYYGYVMATGKLSGASSDEVSGFFSNLMTSTGTMTGWMIVAVLLAFGVCSLGLQNGIERITKVMMICLLALIVVLAVHSVTLDGAMEGVKFYQTSTISVRQVLETCSLVRCHRHSLL